MSTFTPHTGEDISVMLDDLGISSVDDLYNTIPGELRLTSPLNIPDGISEVEVIEELTHIARSNKPARGALVSFAGGGAYDHDLSAAARALGAQPAFVTAYTPYQPEVAQGVLQALFEYQTLVARLFGLPIANASLYDGAASLVEAVNLSVGYTKRTRILLSDGVNPRYRQTLATFAKGSSLEIVALGLEDDLLTIRGAQLSEAAAVVIGYPNFYGTVEDIGYFADLAHGIGALLVVVADPLALGILKSPGDFGADIAVGEGQSLGLPLSYGGPYLGLFATKTDYVRLIPGRLVGETQDLEGKRAFVTTLRTREQDIRREKATSNVCTNQTLMAIQAAIHMSWLGKEGFQALSRRNFDAAHYLAARLRAIGIEIVNPQFFREFTVRISDAEGLRNRMLDHGFLAGVLSDRAKDLLVLTATEARTQDQIDSFAEALSKELR